MSNAFDEMKKLKNNTYSNSSQLGFVSHEYRVKRINFIAWLSIVVIFGVMFLIWLFITNIQPSNTAEPRVFKQNVIHKPTLQIVKSFICPVDMLGTPGVCGVAQNNTNHFINYAQIDVNLYDGRKYLVATAMANITNIPPNGTWQFRAVPMSFNIPVFYSYEIVNILTK